MYTNKKQMPFTDDRIKIIICYTNHIKCILCISCNQFIHLSKSVIHFSVQSFNYQNSQSLIYSLFFQFSLVKNIYPNKYKSVYRCGIKCLDVYV